MPSKASYISVPLGIVLAILPFIYYEFIKTDYSKLSYSIIKELDKENINKREVDELIYRVEKDLNRKINPSLLNEYASSIVSIYKSIDSNAVIKLNEKVFCDLTQKSQVVDLSIRSDIAGHDIFVAVKLLPIEDTIDIKYIEYFYQIIKNINASKGVIISSGIYSNEVIDYAKTHMIDICSLKDATSRKWSEDIALPVIWKNITPKLYVHLNVVLAGGDKMHRDFTKAELSINNGKTEFTIAEYFIEKWNNNEIPHQTDNLLEINHNLKGLKLKVNGKDWRRVSQFRLAYQVQSENYLKYFIPEKYKAIENYITGDTQFSELEIGITPFENDGTWTKIDLDKLDIYGLIVFGTVEDIILNDKSIEMDNFSIKEVN